MEGAVGSVFIPSFEYLDEHVVVEGSGELKFRVVLNGFSADVRIAVHEGKEKKYWEMFKSKLVII